MVCFYNASLSISRGVASQRAHPVTVMPTRRTEWELVRVIKRFCVRRLGLRPGGVLKLLALCAGALFMARQALLWYTVTEPPPPRDPYSSIISVDRHDGAGSERAHHHHHASSEPPHGCAFTKGAAFVVADSMGAVCTRYDLSDDGCCSSQTEQHEDMYSCGGCDPLYHCCTDLPHCVACCLAPEHAFIRDDVYTHTSHHPTYRTGVLHDALSERETLWPLRNFSLCETRCRTSSAGTLHENAYRSALKHCFDIYRPPLHDSSDAS